MERKQQLRSKVGLFNNSLNLLFEVSKCKTFLIFMFCVLQALIAPLSAIIYQKFLDVVVKMVEFSTWTNQGLYLLTLMTLLNLFSFLINGILSLIKQEFSEKLDIHITDKVLKKVALLPMETFDNAEVYNHINRATTQTSSNCLHLLEAISGIIYSAVKGFSFIYILVHFSWPLVLVSVLSLFPLLHISIRINHYWYKTFYNRSEKKRLIDYLKGIMVKNEYVKEIKLYGVATKIISLINRNSIHFLYEDNSARKKFLKKKVGVQWLDAIISFLAKILLFTLGLKSNCSLGTILLYFNSLDNLKVSYSELIDQVSTLEKSLLYMESLDVLIHEREDNFGGQDTFDSEFDEIEFKNVSFRYPGCSNYVLRNINMKFKRGETYFIVGFNGSGKTTLVKLLLRLYTPTEGQILMGGKSINDIKIDDYYYHISAIFQDFVKYPFDVYENVAIRKQCEEKGRFDKVLRYVGMRKFVDNLPNKEYTLLTRDWTGGMELSQGQWQKLAIARCIYGNNIISILDEPFSSIDAEAENFIISNLRKNRGDKLTIFITHRFSSISVTDRVYVMKDGSIIEEGTHQTLIKNEGIYYKLYSSQKLE